MKSFINGIISILIIAAALCILCFVMYGSRGSGTPFAVLSLLFPVLGVIEFMLPNPSDAE